MTYGFVYVLTNDWMPDLIKVGCTERSPAARADELSRPTGVPSSFTVEFYAEFEDHQRIERDLHRWLAPYRINDGREFFHGSDVLRDAVRYLYWHPEEISVSAHRHLGLTLDIVSIRELPSPWKAEVGQAPTTLQLVAHGGFD